MDSTGELEGCYTAICYVNCCITLPYSSASIIGASDGFTIIYYYCKSY